MTASKPYIEVRQARRERLIKTAAKTAGFYFIVLDEPEESYDDWMARSQSILEQIIVGGDRVATEFEREGIILRCCSYEAREIDQR